MFAISCRLAPPGGASHLPEHAYVNVRAVNPKPIPYGDLSIQIIPTLGPKVCRYYLHWAIWIPRGILASFTGDRRQGY